MSYKQLKNSVMSVDTTSSNVPPPLPTNGHRCKDKFSKKTFESEILSKFYVSFLKIEKMMNN
jgi:hypothetical protein